MLLFHSLPEICKNLKTMEVFFTLSFALNFVQLHIDTFILLIAEQVLKHFLKINVGIISKVCAKADTSVLFFVNISVCAYMFLSKVYILKFLKFFAKAGLNA